MALPPPPSFWAIPARWAFLCQGALILAAALVVYAPALQGAFLWDDPQYVTANPLLNDPARLWKTWFAPGSYMEFYPLQETALALQWQLWGAQPFGYHLTNVALQIVSAFLLWRLFAKLGLGLAWLGGLLFVVHPLNVESVAWISELKNTLSLPPLLLAMIALIRYVDQRRSADYFWALGFFTVAMLVKISMAPFPFVILLYFWWKNGRVGKSDCLLAAPFLAVALVLSALTVWSYSRYGQLHPDHPVIPPIGGIFARVALAGLSVSFYFARFFWPGSPMPIYSQWRVDPPAWDEFLPWLFWAALIAGCWRGRKGWGRHALLGLGFFLLMIAPFSGFATQGYMYFTWVMDHLIYIPMIGLIGLVIALVEEADRRASGPVKAVLFALVGGVTLLLAGQSRAYAAAWSDEAQLWAYAARENPGAWLAHYNLGNELRMQGRLEEAMAEYRTAIRLHPAYDWSHNNLGLCLALLPGRQAEAASEFREALRIRPDDPEAHANLANVLAQGGDVTGAIAEYQAALAQRPDFPQARYDLALALANAGRLDEAAAQLRELLRRQPGYAPAEELRRRLGN